MKHWKAALVLVVLCRALPAGADILEVPSVEYPTIASALAAASDGDEVVLAAGTYYESNLMLPQYTHTILRGATGNPADVIIDGEGNNRVVVFQYTESGTRLEDLTVTGGGGTSSGAGVNIWYSTLVVENCIIRDNSCSGWGAGSRAYGNTCDLSFTGCQFLDNASGDDGGGFAGTNGPFTVSFTDCLFRGNSSGDDGGGINLYTCDANVTHCTFVENLATGNGSAMSVSHGSAIASHCIITGNEGGPGVFKYSAGEITFTCTDIWNNAGGNWTQYQFEDQLGVDGNIEQDPQFCSLGGSYDDLALQVDSPCADCDGDYMGAYPVDCGDVGLSGSDWSTLKTLY